RACSPVVDAEVSLRQIPLEPGDGRALGHDFRSTGEHGGFAPGRMVRRFVTKTHGRWASAGSGDRTLLRGALCVFLRPNKIVGVGFGSAHRMGPVQGAL